LGANVVMWDKKGSKSKGMPPFNQLWKIVSLLLCEVKVTKLKLLLWFSFTFYWYWSWYKWWQTKKGEFFTRLPYSSRV